MNEREVEKKIAEAADKIELRDFDEVWSEIKDKIDERPAKKKRKIIKWVSALAVSLCLILTCSIAIPKIIQNQPTQEKTYLDEELDKKSVTEETFYLGLENLNNEYIISLNYIKSDYVLFYTKDNKIVGGKVSLLGNDDNARIINIEFYSKVVVGEIYINRFYDKEYSTNGAQIEYGLKEHFEEYGLYTYYIKAEYNSLKYYIEYTCMEEDIRPFLDEFFS